MPKCWQAAAFIPSKISTKRHMRKASAIRREIHWIQDVKKKQQPSLRLVYYFLFLSVFFFNYMNIKARYRNYHITMSCFFSLFLSRSLAPIRICSEFIFHIICAVVFLFLCVGINISICLRIDNNAKCHHFAWTYFVSVYHLIFLSLTNKTIWCVSKYEWRFHQSLAHTNKHTRGDSRRFSSIKAYYNLVKNGFRMQIIYA